MAVAGPVGVWWVWANGHPNQAVVDWGAGNWRLALGEDLRATDRVGSLGFRSVRAGEARLGKMIDLLGRSRKLVVRWS